MIIWKYLEKHRQLFTLVVMANWDVVLCGWLHELEFSPEFYLVFVQFESSKCFGQSF